ncbi:MAG: TIGR03915 family putative DNA repair protein [Gammaproteobacteria bacterium]
MTPITRFSEWRSRARDYLQRAVPPEQIHDWTQDARQGSLFDSPAVSAEPINRLTVPRAFVELAQWAALYRAEDRWALLYRILWRLTHGEPELLTLVVDDDIHRFHARIKAVQRDRHKMKAFVRFKQVPQENGEDCYVAWFEPQHWILPSMGDFFQRRFANMHWRILTPDGSLEWDGQQLRHDPAPCQRPPLEDAMESAWQTYYRSTFNPARLKPDAMVKEMPKRYWRHLPEAVQIPDLMRAAQQRVDAMLTAEQTTADSLRQRSKGLALQQDRFRQRSDRNGD